MPAFPARGTSPEERASLPHRKWRRLLGAARLAISSTAVLVGSYPGVPIAWSDWLTAVRAPPAAEAYPDLWTESSAGALNVLMAAAQNACQQAPRLLLLSDEPAAWMWGSYLLYPQRLDVVQSVDGFTAANLDEHSGGCVLWYGSQGTRLEPFVERLAPLRCTAEGCLYRVRDGGTATVQKENGYQVPADASRHR